VKYTNFDGFEACGGLAMLKTIIDAKNTIDFGGSTQGGKFPPGWVKVAAKPYDVFVKPKHKEDLLYEFGRARCCAPAAAESNNKFLTQHAITMTCSDFLEIVKECSIDKFIVKGHGMKASFKWSHNLIHKMRLADFLAKIKYDLALSLPPGELHKFGISQDARSIYDAEDANDPVSMAAVNSGAHDEGEEGAVHSEEEKFVTLALCTDVEPVERQFGRRAKVIGWPMFTNAQAEQDCFLGCLPVFGSVKNCNQQAIRICRG